jgi:hypothetical protein
VALLELQLHVLQLQKHLHFDVRRYGNVDSTRLHQSTYKEFAILQLLTISLMLTCSLHSLPPELILLVGSFLPTAALNALALTCGRQYGILQSELEARLTPALAQQLLVWAAASNPHLVQKLLAPPHLLKPSAGYGFYGVSPLHVAAQAGCSETAALLLAAGANPNLRSGPEDHPPLYFAVENNDLAMVALLLDNGAQVDMCILSGFQ